VYYFLLLFGVMCFLTLMAWRYPAALTRNVARAGVPATAAGGEKETFARFFKDHRKEDMPCVTPIDCVQTNRCAGHCGCH
jgi:hypothetical protein